MVDHRSKAESPFLSEEEAVAVQEPPEPAGSPFVEPVGEVARGDQWDAPDELGGHEAALEEGDEALLDRYEDGEGAEIETDEAAAFLGELEAQHSPRMRREQGDYSFAPKRERTSFAGAGDAEPELQAWREAGDLDLAQAEEEVAHPILALFALPKAVLNAMSSGLWSLALGSLSARDIET